MEGPPMVCYSTGTMESLLDKLTKLKNSSNPIEEFSVLTEKLKEDLLGLKKDFVELAVPKRQVCMKQVRELVFEVEDWIDQKPETNMEDPSDTKKIQYFVTKIKTVHARFTWYYKLLKIVPTEPDVVLDHAPRKINLKHQFPTEEKPCGAFLDGPRDKLIKYLTAEKEGMLKVVSVIGREGIGKTTLAMEIYSEIHLHGHFECQAFVYVGRRRPMREILNDILHQVKIKGVNLNLEVQSVITELRIFLDKKRYFILLDGICSTWAWKVIACALPNNQGSRVMTTTCIIDVGNSCSSYPDDLVYQMEALRDKTSKILFRSKMNHREEIIADFKEVCGEMLLKMCGGVPLGIIIAGDLLARKSEDPIQLKMLGRFILSSLKQYSTSNGMTKILHMSYADLSLPLRSCLLYLSVFLENYTIMKDRLIFLWGAEGFIPIKDEECLWITGEKYFNELISRRLIQPVFTCDDVQAVGCTVHIVILDFIRSISREENFATRSTELSSGPFPCDTIRRFSMDCGNEDVADTLSTSSIHLSCMRSVTVFGDVIGKLYPLDDEIIYQKKIKDMCKASLEMRKNDRGTLYPQGLPLFSKHGEEMHGTEDPGVSIKQMSSKPPHNLFGKVEGKLDHADFPASNERISGPQPLTSVSRRGAEMHGTRAPGISIKQISSKTPPNFSRKVEGKLYHADFPVGNEMISDPQGQPSVSKHGEEMHASEAPRIHINIVSAFKLLRVLDLEDTKNLKDRHLKGIGGLVLLKYLGLGGTEIYNLPEEIGELEQLETLDLRRNIMLRDFPASSVKLQKLRHLLHQGYATQIWEMPHLEVASGIGVGTKISCSLGMMVELLRKSEHLMILGLILREEPIPTATDLVSFLDEAVKSKLHSLSIDFRSSDYKMLPRLLDSWERVTTPLAQQFEPQRLEIKISYTQRVPPNMGSFASLTHLHITVGQAKAEDILFLGGLTNLVLLHLTALECSESERLVIKRGTFSCLKVFCLTVPYSWMRLELEEEAMPQLQRLGRVFIVDQRENHSHPITRMEHLTCLMRVHATLNCRDATVSQVQAAEAAIRRQASEIASKPTLELSKTFEKLMVKDEEGQNSLVSTFGT